MGEFVYFSTSPIKGGKASIFIEMLSKKHNQHMCGRVPIHSMKQKWADGPEVQVILANCGARRSATNCREAPFHLAALSAYHVKFGTLSYSFREIVKVCGFNAASWYWRPFAFCNAFWLHTAVVCIICVVTIAIPLFQSTISVPNVMAVCFRREKRKKKVDNANSCLFTHLTDVE